MEDLIGDLSFEQSCVLFFKGVHLKDYLTIEDRVIEKAPPVINQQKVWDDLPNTFTSWEEWPDATNLKCWHCDFVPTGVPIAFPTMVDGNVHKINSMKMRGNFCNFSCAAGYIMNHYHGDEKWRLIENLKLMLYLKTGELQVEIKPMPDRTVMVSYGGTMSIVDYKELIKQHSL